jgi:LmbE family N-acetylglucosaminyl deacetylase
VVTIVSPHPDDAAFSLGGTIPQLRAPKRLVTVFGRSSYTIDGAVDDGETEVTRRRRSEDCDFAERSGLAWTYLDLPSASLRQRLSGAPIFIAGGEPAVTDVERASWTEEIFGAVFAEMPGDATTLLLLPAGLGGHRDHVFLSECLRGHAESRAIRTAFYEDLPYAMSLSEAEIRSLIGAIDPALSPVLVPIAGFLQQRLSGLQIYQSQIDSTLIDSLASAATRYGAAAERLWADREQTILDALAPLSCH